MSILKDWGEKINKAIDEVLEKREYSPLTEIPSTLRFWLAAAKNKTFRERAEQAKRDMKSGYIKARQDQRNGFVETLAKVFDKVEAPSTVEVKLGPNLELFPWQKEVDKDKSRFKYLKVGRRAGKTWYARNWQINLALKTPKSDHYYVAKTRVQARDLSWREFLEAIPEGEIEGKNETALRIVLKNGSRIYLKGSDDDENNLRGKALASLVMEEAAFQKAGIYDRIFRPMLADLRAPALFISSPKKGWFTRICDLVQAGKVKDSRVFHYTIKDNPKIDIDEIEAIRSSTPEDVWLQEYMAEVVENSGCVYGEFTDHSVFNPSTAFVGHEKWPCVVGLDWGQWDDTGVVWLHISPQGEVIVSKEHVRGGWDSKRHAEVIQMYGKGRNIETGNYVIDRANFRNESTSQTSIADQFREHLGFGFQRSEKDVNTGIDLMKRYMRGDGNKPWLYISAGCSEVLKGLREWERGDHEPDVIAALRYALVHAVKRNLTTLADGSTRVNFSGEMFEDDAQKRIMGLKPPKNLFRRERWGWDSEFGVPEIGQEEGSSLWA